MHVEDKLVLSLKENQFAPVFNTEATDMLNNVFLKQVHEFQRHMIEARKSKESHAIEVAKRIRMLLLQATGSILEFMASNVVEKREILDADDGQVLDILERFPFTSRDSLSQRPWRHVPVDANLDDIIVYRTAGTTAQPMNVPSHPVATGCYSPMIVEAMHRWNVHPAFSPDGVGIALVGFQASSVTVATRLQALNNSGFVKLNIAETEWRDPLDPYRYIIGINPKVLTGDPFSFAQFAHIGDILIDRGEMKRHFQPACLVTTAVALKESIRKHLEGKFTAPVIDLYSLTETGPIAYGCKAGKGYHVIPHDIHVETIGQDGRPVGEGELGEITVSGGRNPYFPLVRYRTGDWGRLDRSGTCTCGDAMPRIFDLEGRMPIQYHTTGGKWINDRDISAIMHEYPVTRFRFHQGHDGRFSLVARLAPFDTTTTANDLEAGLRRVLGDEAVVGVTLDATLGDRDSGKVIPFTTDYPLFYD